MRILYSQNLFVVRHPFSLHAACGYAHVHYFEVHSYDWLVTTLWLLIGWRILTSDWVHLDSESGSNSVYSVAI